MTNLLAAGPYTKPTLVVDNVGFVKPYHSSNLRTRKKLTVHTNPGWRNKDERAADIFVNFLEGRFREELARNFGGSEADIHVSQLPEDAILKIAVKALRESKGYNVTVVQMKDKAAARITMSRRKR